MDAFFAFLDEPILLALHRLALSCGAFFTPFLRFVSLLAEHGIGPILLSLCLCFFKKTRRAGAGALLSLLLGAVCTNLILKNLVARPRPFADPTGLYYAFWQSAGAVQASVTASSFPACAPFEGAERSALARKARSRSVSDASGLDSSV